MHRAAVHVLRAGGRDGGGDGSQIETGSRHSIRRQAGMCVIAASMLAMMRAPFSFQFDQERKTPHENADFVSRVAPGGVTAGRQGELSRCIQGRENFLQKGPLSNGRPFQKVNLIRVLSRLPRLGRRRYNSRSNITGARIQNAPQGRWRHASRTPLWSNYPDALQGGEGE